MLRGLKKNNGTFEQYKYVKMYKNYKKSVYKSHVNET